MEYSRLCASLGAGTYIHHSSNVFTQCAGEAPVDNPLEEDVAILGTRSPGRNEPCPCGSGKKFKRCCLDSTYGAIARPHGENAQADLEEGATLFIRSGTRVITRRIPTASALPVDARHHGYAAETATHDAAVIWGMPDFVYRPLQQRVGSGMRELGDGILLVGDVGAVLQVKSRGGDANDPDRERRWVLKQTAQALSQGAGTIRRLKQQPATLTNLRGREVVVDGNDHRWLVVAVIDHPDPPDDTKPPVFDKAPAIVLLRRDWEFLFDQLKSTYAVIQYLERVAGEPIELGTESMRYYDLALADSEATPGVLDPELVSFGKPVSTPLLPLAPAANTDLEAHYMVREIFEAIAVTTPIAADEKDRLRALAELDRLPVGMRADIGRFVLGSMAEVSELIPDDVVWNMRSVRGPAGQAHLGFVVCSRPFRKELQDLFGCWVQLRHHDALAARRDVEHLTTVAAMLSPRDDTYQSWDTTMAAVSGEIGFSAPELKELRQLWPSRAA
jgi:hypothetical protein